MSEETEIRTRGRPAKFDRSIVIEKVQDLFWREGVRSVSLLQISKETGLSRSSLINTFGSKEKLIEETLTQYSQDITDDDLVNLPAHKTIGEVLHTNFRQLARNYAGHPVKRGCYGVKCIAELKDNTGQTSDFLEEYYFSLRDVFANLVEMAVQRGELPDKTRIKPTANLILSFLGGLSIFSKSGGTEAELTEMVDQFLSQIGFASRFEIKVS